MISRERVLKAFGRLEGMPDRPPVQFDLCRQLIEAFSNETGIQSNYSHSYYEDLTYRISANGIRTALGSDVVVVGGTVKKGFVAEPVGEGINKNELGMYMKRTELYMEVVECPLKDALSLEDIRKYEFPDPYADGRFDKAARDIKRYKSSHFIMGDCELSLFEMAWHLTGMQEYMMAFAMEEDWITALNDKVEAWTMGLADQLVDLGVDAIWFGEDLGSQTSMLISPDSWRKEFKPRYKRMIESLKKKNPNLLIILHSDGAVAPLIDDFVEIGVNIYNPVQPNVPGSDPEELEKELRYRASVMGKEGNYLMAPAHVIQADTTTDTVKSIISIIKNLNSTRS